MAVELSLCRVLLPEFVQKQSCVILISFISVRLVIGAFIQ